MPLKELRRQLGRMAAGYLQSHAQSLVYALGELKRNALPSTASCAVIAIGLALPALFLLALEGVRDIVDDAEQTARLSLFLSQEHDNGAAEDLASSLEGQDGVGRIQVITREQALAEFAELSGLGGTLEALGENPLPPVVVVNPSAGLDPPAIEALAAELREREEIDRVQVDTVWIQRLDAVLELARRTALAVAALLTLGAFLIVGNTIRLVIEHRRDRIELMKVLGATEPFIRRPFLYIGLWLGLMGGIGASLLVAGTTAYLAEPITRTAELYGGTFEAGLPDTTLLLLLWLVGAGLGVAGAWLAVGRHLRHIVPES